MTTYIPLLRWKRGEKNALSNLLDPTKVNTVPLFLLGADQFKPKKATKTNPPVPASLIVAQDVATHWGATSFYLDASHIADVPGQPHRIESIAAECRNLQLGMIPAINLGASAQYVASVQNILSIDHRGACLRVDLSEMTNMANWISSWPIAISQTDLIIDFGDQSAVVASLGNALNITFTSLYSGSHWRTVSMAGTSIPENFTGLQQGLHLIPRHEKIIWQQLKNANLPYDLGYGDYATVSLATPAPSIAWGYPITVKYTLENQFLICRGVRTKGVGAKDLDVQLVGHANAIATYANRGSLAYCWADQEIDAIAGGKGPQGLEHWVHIGVNRHIEKIRSILP